jgi:hypothetical protein
MAKVPSAAAADKSFLRETFKFKWHFSTGYEFQNLFAQVMRNVYGHDFQAVRPYGRRGDKKCDGYLRSRKMVFQCYAPASMKEATVLAKIKEDFVGAKTHWESGMETWCFVHNGSALTANVVQLMEELRHANPTIDIREWTWADAREQFDSLSASAANDIFGYAPTTPPKGRIPRERMRWLRSKITDSIREIAIRPEKSGQKILSLLAAFSHVNSICDRKSLDLLIRLQAASEKKWPRSIIEQLRNIMYFNVVDNLRIIAEVFGAYTGNPCAVALKKPVKTRNEIRITAVARDSRSAPARSRSDDGIFTLADNTPFEVLSHGLERYYICNDLAAQHKLGRYCNPRPDWKLDYNATVVSAIRVPEKDDLSRYDGPIIAFLCIDNHAGGFDDGDCLKYLEIFKARLASVLYEIKAMDDLEEVSADMRERRR